ncbi:[Citrate [pro-3S]-lyase] ligase [Commensalibacter sp. Nvir]|uniref:[citrate (pro-3S)-lyase] ligase n=1 Tax=Commensalibacter sp. Nvir TaxID=3069817 RepID=UPI002D5387E2|nr:[Citrate [pro-3S]-lyase] ligase [Commensalibacter sp. Nvir]
MFAPGMMSISDGITLSVLQDDDLQSKLKEITQFLTDRGLNIDVQVKTFILAYNQEDNQIVGCAGLDKNVVKCVCVDEQFRGSGLSVKIGTEVIKRGLSEGYDDLFLYTKYKNLKLFRGWGFTPLVELPDVVAFMNYNSQKFRDYLEGLQTLKKNGSRIGSVVMNANPFTNGHRYLVEQASKNCDWVHVFLVREDVSLFSYKTRLELVREGLADINNVTVHEGSDYIISHATFPQYFLKNDYDVNTQASAIDALMFRRYIAPALNISVRYVGTEPLDKTTARYNLVLKKFLNTYPYNAKPIELKELERLKYRGVVVSASRVRRLMEARNYEGIKDLVPESTFVFIKNASDNCQKKKETL